MIALIMPQKTCPFLSRQRRDGPQGGFLVAHRAFVMTKTLMLFFHRSSASPTKPATTVVYYPIKFSMFISRDLNREVVFSQAPGRAERECC